MLKFIQFGRCNACNRMFRGGPQGGSVDGGRWFTRKMVCLRKIAATGGEAICGGCYAWERIAACKPKVCMGSESW